MQHKLLLGSTALVSAGLLMASAAQAQGVGGIEVVLGGYTEFGVKAATEDTNTDGENDRHYHFFMDNEVFINANGVTDGGVQYGSHLELEVGSGDGNTDNAFVDEIGLFFAGNFGRFELGKEDGAEDVMGIGGEDAQAGTGGIDGDTTNLEPFFEVPDTSDSTKISYFTPRVAGFQLGASWTPDDGDGVTDDGDDQENILSGGINWVGALGPADLTVAATGIMGDNEDNDGDDLEAWEVGFLAGFGGLSFGAKYGQLLDLGEGQFLNGGIKYGFGAANASLGYTMYDPDDGDTNHVFFISGDVGLMPGVVLKGDVSYATDDPAADDDEWDNVFNRDVDTDDTIAGVLTIQLNY
ncbi:MAG TPA: porin [Geminicoccaceae bacterium]|nr:porin [Geminicoccaceae bacterium]